MQMQESINTCGVLCPARPVRAQSVHPSPFLRNIVKRRGMAPRNAMRYDIEHEVFSLR